MMLDTSALDFALGVLGRAGGYHADPKDFDFYRATCPVCVGRRHPSVLLLRHYSGQLTFNCTAGCSLDAILTELPIAAKLANPVADTWEIGAGFTRLLQSGYIKRPLGELLGEA